MSAVRMCDRCGTVFSENSDGWETYTASRMKKDPMTGQPISIKAQLDACPNCSIVTEPPIPKMISAVFPSEDQTPRIEHRHSSAKGPVDDE